MVATMEGNVLFQKIGSGDEASSHGRYYPLESVKKHPILLSRWFDRLQEGHIRAKIQPLPQTDIQMFFVDLDGRQKSFDLMTPRSYPRD